MALAALPLLLLAACRGGGQSRTTAVPSAPASGSASPTPIASPALTGTLFDDEFAGTSLDTSQWVAVDRRGDGGNNEAQCYQPQNATEASGVLTLTSRAQSGCSGLDFTSAMVQWRSFTMHFGTIQVRARQSGGVGTWPAIWLLGADCQQTNVRTADNTGSCQWPHPGSDEVDVAEIMNGDLDTVHQWLHTTGKDASCSPQASNVAENWHVYELDWTPSTLVWKIDGQTTCSMSNAVPQQPMFLLINTALGGNGGGSIDARTLPQHQQVDWVRVFPQGVNP